MQSEVTITQRTTRRSLSCLCCTNITYFLSVHGALKLLQFVIGLIIIAIQSYIYDHYYDAYVIDYDGAGLYVLIIATSCFITTFTLFISNLMSMTTSTIMPKTVFEYLYHGIAALLNTTAGVAFMIKLPRGAHHYHAQMTAAVMTLINAGLYAASAILAYISFASS